MKPEFGTAPQPGSQVDLVVIGAGGAGMAAALSAAIQGARVLLVESSEYVGGTTALSGGTAWIPGTHHCDTGDTLDTAAAYLDRCVGQRTPATLRRALLDAGPEAVAFFERHSEVRFRAYPLHPDYLSEVEGSTVRGRALEPLPFDGRLLGRLFRLVRPPIPEFTVLGGMMVDRTDIGHLLRLGRSFKSFRHATRLLIRHAIDRLRHPRGTRLVMGNALVGRLLYSLSRQPTVILLTATQLMAIRSDAQGVRAVTLRQGDSELEVAVDGGLLLASGGFNRQPQWRRQQLGEQPQEWCPGAPGHTGQAQQLALDAGAHHAGGAMSPCFWAPVSLRRRADGSQAVFPHFLMDRGKPGFLTVDSGGCRFVNETTSYHLFALAMRAGREGRPAVPAFLVADDAAVRQYGIGMVRPGGGGLADFQADGYLVSAPSLAELAAKLGIDAGALSDTVARFNAHAAAGSDPDFQRGETAYQRNLGDASAGLANPCLGALATPPFHAVRLYPGDIGAAMGLATDASARVLDAAGAPIPGLYAAGNDMHSVMGGVYTGPGITIGPGLVFAHLAASHALARARADHPSA